MKTNLKETKGITLVALVITIVVLLILATVAIVSLSGENNIIKKAQKAKDDYAVSSANEESKLGEYENKIETYTGKNTVNPWIGWGLSSPNVVFNTPDSSMAYVYTSGDATGLCDSNGVIMIFYSDGGFYTGWDGKSYTAKQCEQMLGSVILEDNLVIVPSEHMGFVFKSSNLMECYDDYSITSVSNLNNILNSENRENYLTGTFTATLQD